MIFLTLLMAFSDLRRTLFQLMEIPPRLIAGKTAAYTLWSNTMPPVISWILSQQEGQHPLTGQRAANFRLLANQWAERRLVTQWRHGWRAVRRSVCNAGASNAGRSLCVQISRERSYPQPIAINCLSSGINILAGGSSVPLISERQGTDPHWKHLRCTHFQW